MHAKPDLRVFLKWMVAGSGSVITNVITPMPKKLRILPAQADVCERLGVTPQAPLHDDRLGIAVCTLQLAPINGMRIPELSGSSGWYIFGGDEASDREEFYSPLCVRHIPRHCQIVVPYLFLPAGWRFQIDSDGYEDVWYDDSLVRPR